MTIERLGFLASHRGSNMQAIIDACKQGRLPATPVVVISNNGSSGALERAEIEGVPAYHVSRKTFATAGDEDCAIRDTLLRHETQLVVLAGYMKRVGPATLAAFSGRIINIHPALLPAYGGEGMYGDRVHAAVLENGDSETGVTIHLVNEDYDTGPVLAQRKVPVRPGDTVETLARRVLAVEHETYVATVGRIISGEIDLPPAG